MREKDDIFQIVNSGMLSITSQVTGISLTQAQPVDMSGACTLCLSAKGSYQLNLFLYADRKSLARIAANMKRAPATEDEVRLYTVEYFNILGGGIISKINSLFKKSARFTSPVFLDYMASHESSSENNLTFDYYFQDESNKEGKDFCLGLKGYGMI